MPESADKRRIRPWIVGLIALAVSAVFVARVLMAVDGDATIFTAFGEDAVETRQYAEERLGEVFLRVGQGHDGKFFFVQANDPWLLEPAENADILDLPRYRSQRMFYPVLAGGGGLLGPEAIVWSMVLVNVLAFGIGTWATALVAREMGGSPWLGMAFLLNIGLISSVNVGGADVVAAAAAFGAVAALMMRRHGLGVLLLVAAVLTREVMLVVAVGSAIWLWRNRERRSAITALLGPPLAAGAWAGYIRLRIEAGEPALQAIGPPFEGIAQSFAAWLTLPINLLAGLAMLGILIVYAWRALKSGELVGWAFLGFVPLAFFFTDYVWASYFDISRAIAPLLTAFALMILAPRKSSIETVSESVEDGSSLRASLG